MCNCEPTKTSESDRKGRQEVWEGCRLVQAISRAVRSDFWRSTGAAAEGGQDQKGWVLRARDSGVGHHGGQGRRSGSCEVQSWSHTLSEATGPHGSTFLDILVLPLLFSFPSTHCMLRSLMIPISLAPIKCQTTCVEHVTLFSHA